MLYLARMLQKWCETNAFTKATLAVEAAHHLAEHLQYINMHPAPYSAERDHMSPCRVFV